ncbi:MAG: hypothetical protein LBE67_10560 [Kocuria palustris]|nr:hypothetical protein [Kocuria palustris]
MIGVSLREGQPDCRYSMPLEYGNGIVNKPVWLEGNETDTKRQWLAIGQTKDRAGTCQKSIQA